MKIRCGNCFNEYEETYGMCPFCGYTVGDGPKEPCCLTQGTEIGNRYIIGQCVDMGGFGIIYKAWDKKLEAVMAIKEYYPGGLVNRVPGGVDVILTAAKREREFIYGKTRFLEEARNMAKFNTHKNIVNVFDYFEANNTAYIVMEYLDGKNLKTILREQNVPMPYERCISIIQDVCDALKAIHSEHILHRDISPDNIIICKDGTVKLIDFGAARFSVNSETQMTIILKPGFAPPEQYDKVNRQGPWTDVYALGATMYYALTLQKPDESTSRKVADTLKPPCEIEPQVPEYVSGAIMKSMALEPLYRFQTVGEFEKALLNPRKIESIEADKKKKRRNRTVGIVVAALALVVAFGFFQKNWNAEKEKATLPNAEITLLYQAPSDKTAAKKKAEAIDSVIAGFTAQYTTVEITAKAESAEECERQLEANGNEALIVESTGFPDKAMENADDVSALRRDTDSGRLYFNKDVSSPKQFPVGITVPVIYINTTIISPDSVKGSVSDIAAACNQSGCGMVIDSSAKEMLEQIWMRDSIAPYLTDTAVSTFTAGNAGVLIGSEAVYSSVQQSVAGHYAIKLPDSKDNCYIYSDFWSVRTKNKNSKIVAEHFLQYLVSGNAQDYLHIQDRDNTLPINMDAMKTYAETYSEFKSLPAYLSAK